MASRRIIIILATVTINMAFGDNGLIKQAQLAKDMVANSTLAEQEGMNSVMSEYLNTMGEESEIIPLVEEVPTIIANPIKNNHFSLNGYFLLLGNYKEVSSFHNLVIHIFHFC